MMKFNLPARWIHVSTFSAETAEEYRGWLANHEETATEFAREHRGQPYPWGPPTAPGCPVALLDVGGEPGGALTFSWNPGKRWDGGTFNGRAARVTPNGRVLVGLTAHRPDALAWRDDPGVDVPGAGVIVPEWEDDVVVLRRAGVSASRAWVALRRAGYAPCVAWTLARGERVHRHALDTV